MDEYNTLLDDKILNRLKEIDVLNKILDKYNLLLSLNI
jgi:hypothetical protein